MSIYRIARALPFSGLFRQLEHEAETVISVLQPGPLGIIEHKFTPQEIRQAKATVCRSVENWRRHSEIDHANGVLNHFISEELVSSSSLLFPFIFMTHE